MASTNLFSPKFQNSNQAFAAVRAKNSQHNKKVIRNLPQIPSLKMNHLSPTNAAVGGTMVTPTNNQRNQGGIQSLTIETGS